MLGVHAHLIAFLATTSLAGCASMDLGGSGSGGDEAAPVVATLDSAAPKDNQVDVDGADEEDSGDATGLAADSEPDLTPEDFGEGFCVDDIYAKHLIQHYNSDPAAARSELGKTLASDNDAPAKSKGRHRHGKARSGYSRRRMGDRNAAYYQRRKEFQALAYAHDVMNGRTNPYFGAIPIVVNDKVNFWIQYFKTSGRKMFMRWLVRGESLKPMVQPLLQDNGLPMEFFYLAMIESGLSNSASSRARAAGTWQFMKGTAKLYGLKINHWVDERRDPAKSTVAAANFLKDLYGDLGDWHLAMAAYNAGPGKVHRAVKVMGTNNFWELAQSRHLAKETKEYVPKFLAAMLLAAEAKSHGFEVQPDITDAIPDATVTIKRPVKLDELARQLGVPHKTLARWNPELLRNVTPPGKNGYQLRLTSTLAEKFSAAEHKLSTVEIKDVHMHTVQQGETLGRIARRYKVTVQEIRGVNPDIEAHRLRPGTTIAIPVPDMVITARKNESA